MTASEDVGNDMDNNGVQQVGEAHIYFELVYPGYGDYVYPYLTIQYLTYTQYVPGDIPKVPACLKETHVDVAEFLEGIPQKKGKPAINKFSFSDRHDCISNYRYSIPMDIYAGDILYVAAHAKVSMLDYMTDIQTALPASVTASAVSPGLSDKQSYLDIQLFGGGVLNGWYDGWSADGNGIMISPSSPAKVFSSYGNVPIDAVSIRYNIDLVNWILNHKFIGHQSKAGLGAYTWADVQYAIWKLIEFDNNEWVTHLTPEAIASLMNLYSLERVEEIVNAAKAEGEGFVAGCNDQMAIVVNPVNGAQSAIVPARPKDLVKPCGTREADAWPHGLQFPETAAETFPFPGDPDAFYIRYTVEPPMVP